MQKHLKYLFILMILLLSIDVVNADVNPNSWVAIDGLGREMTTNKTRSTSHHREVGMFFWTWHSSNNRDNIININDVNTAHPTHKNDYTWWHNYVSQFSGSIAYSWNEPIYGYYTSDEYVLRKQAELLADAGVDFVVFDCTNGDAIYREQVDLLLKVWLDAKNNGVNVPKVAFMLPFSNIKNTESAFNKLYEHYYDHNSDNYKKYSSLYYRYNSKKLILAYTNGASSSMQKKLADFTVRSIVQFPTIRGVQAHGSWGWLSAYPQAYYKKADGKAEEISVGIAQNVEYKTIGMTCMNGDYAMGRSYASGNYSYTFSYKGSTVTVGNSISGSTAKSKTTSKYGRNFQQQWEYAISIDPEIVFVTGWNEWNVGRIKEMAGVANCFSDEFDDEHSRDIEPTKGSLKDYYYYQLVKNVRKYKGVKPQAAQKTAVTINKLSDWNNSSILSYDHYTGGYQRDTNGFAKIRYTNKTFRNDIKKAKVSYDNSYIYFYVETVRNLTSYNSDKWMRLLIDTTKNNNDNWEEFEYIVNRVAGNNSKLVLEKSNGGWSFTKVGEVDYKVTGNVLEIKIRREYLNQTGTGINFNFKWCDNNLNNGDIMTIYTDGDAAPGGRFSFHFEGTAAYVKAPEPVQIKFGDVNGDGKINTTDYILVRKYILGTSTFDDKQKQRADTNSDNKIDTSDYITIRKSILYNIPITGIKVETVALDKSNIALKVGDSIVLNPTISPSNANNKNVSWSSSNNNIASVNENGKVIAIASGTAIISVVTSDGNKKATCSVSVSEVPKPIISKMYFIKAGDADSIIIESNGHYGLVDAAINGTQTINVLNQLGVKSLDFIIATHIHKDHLGGMADVAKKFANSNTKYYYRTASGYISDDSSHYKYMNKAIEALKNKGAKLVEVTGKYPKFTMGDFSFELMNTEKASSDEKNPKGEIAGANKDSIVTYVSYKGTVGTLLTGDVESQDEYRLVSKLSNKRIDVLKVAHHSWQSSTTMKFTKAIKPKIAVVTGKYLLDDISTPTYYMQKAYGTKFYVTGKSDDVITIDYSNNLSVSPTKALVADYKITESTGHWRKLQNGIWFYLDNVSDLNSIVYNDWRKVDGKWYYMGLQGNMMTGWIEVNYNGKPCLFYLDTNGVMLTGWQQAKGYSPYNNSLSSYYNTWMYSHVNYTVNAWYQYDSTWANGKNWFYFDPSTGVMQMNKTLTISGKSYTFNSLGICTRGC